MNRRTIAGLLGLCIFLLGALTIFAARLMIDPESAVDGAAAYAPNFQGYPPPGDLPLAGWSVCLVGEMEQIPGDGVRQVFNLCHADGYRIKTYCLDPQKPIPALGTLCSQVVGGGYWCGDAVQQLGFLDLLQGAEDTSTPTVTSTATFTATIPASTTTSTATTTATVGASATSGVTLTPAQATLQFTMTPTLRSTPYERPPAGGPGNLTPLLAMGTLGGLLAAGRAAWIHRRASRYSRKTGGKTRSERGMAGRGSGVRWLKLVLVFLLPGAAFGMLPLLTAARNNDPAVANMLAGGSTGGTGLLATPTAFQPAVNTPTPPVPTVEVIDFIPQNTPVIPPPTPTPVLPFLWNGLDLDDSSELLRLVISAPEPVNGGRPLEIAFRFGKPCEFNDHRACLSSHDGGRLLLATVHSGVGGEGQPLRHALEGTGLNRAGLSLESIAQNVSALQGAPVHARQEDGDAAGDLRVIAAGRVPASEVEEYFALPFDEALALAGIDLTEALVKAKPGESGLLVIETCGWRHEEEGWAPGISDTTGSVYLVVMGRGD